MGKCLKTQLKESVNNSSLEYLGCIDIKINTAFTGDQRLSISGTNVTVEALNGTFDIFDGATGKTSYTAESNMQICPRTVGMTLLIKDKYNIGTVVINRIGNNYTGTELDLNFNAVSKIDGFAITNIGGHGILDLSKNNPDTVYSINNSNYQLVNSATLYIPKGYELTGVRDIVWVTGNAEFELESLYNCKSLQSIKLRDEPKVKGEITNFLDALYANGEGKTDGTLEVLLSGTSCTYNGTAITYQRMTFTFTSEGWSLNS